MPSEIVAKIADSAEEFEKVLENQCELLWCQEVDNLSVKLSVQQIVEPFLIDGLSSIYDVGIDGEDVPLVDFLDEKCNGRLMALVLDKHKIAKRCFFLNLSNYCGAIDLSIGHKSRHDAAAALFNGYFYQDGAPQEIEKCLFGSSLLTIHGANMNNVTVCICAVSFVATKEGIYINWFATSKALFNKAV